MKAQDVDLLNRYIDGDLPDDELADLERRLESEPELRNYVNDMNSLLRSAEALEVFKAPDVNFKRSVRFLHLPINWRFGSFFGGAAVAAACILLIIGLDSRPGKSPVAEKPTHTLRMVYHAPGANSVSVLGDFNGWSDEIPLRPRGDGGYWLVEIPVNPGEYRYILLVDGRETTGDPLADYVIDDDFGSKNSVVRIGL